MSNERPSAPGPGGVGPRFGMYAGPNYAGGQALGANQLPSEQAWKVPPIGFLDDVTRTHDINYTYIEQTYKGNDAATQAAKTQALWPTAQTWCLSVPLTPKRAWTQTQACG